ncbi:sin3 histone deacetylase corepressor complex component SDS3 isoform X2 [Tetranychus urticae]|uniref:Sin3 histone deacetylase corepressor complex component SDS3 n=1 Tax=Tetranychus urticae TaxID=32264 RepID=T1KQV9_TETUR|nr:sin3 histone deacetylase corepressor complex component SDS3 isoform X2 [Tetranychus urticae]
MSDTDYTSETDDASETEVVMERYDDDYLEIKGQSDILNRMYKDKLSNLEEQLRQLDEGIHPDYVRRIETFEKECQDRLILNEAYLAYETERIEKEFISEQQAALRDFEERKIELKKSLIADLEEKKKIAESERFSLELNSDSVETKTSITRKLRRRQNDPVPVPEKRKRGLPTQLNYLLDERDINDDLKALTKVISNR